MFSRRPTSSPGQAEKYPQPLMGFLRSKSNAGSISRSRSRSKGKSRASPLFVRRNKSAAAVTQEPSSPKVTCMGQVRVNLSKPKIQPDSRNNPTRHRQRCEWIRNVSLYNSLVGKMKTMSLWPKWELLWLPCYRQKEKDSPRRQLDCPVTELAGENEEKGNFRTSELLLSPPIKAFLLTRSRSVPYGSSSLAFRFWEENNQREAQSQNGGVQNVKSENTEKVNDVNESVRSTGANIESNGVEELTDVRFIRRPVLTRSKSEPARIGVKMVELLDDEEG